MKAGFRRALRRDASRWACPACAKPGRLRVDQANVRGTSRRREVKFTISCARRPEHVWTFTPGFWQRPNRWQPGFTWMVEPEGVRRA